MVEILNTESNKPICENEYFTVSRIDGTDNYDVLAKYSEKRIGLIKWFNPWKQYVLEPFPGTLWSNGRMADMDKLLTSINPKKV